jgi:hypothetical protein
MRKGHSRPHLTNLQRSDSVCLMATQTLTGQCASETQATCRAQQTEGPAILARERGDAWAFQVLDPAVLVLVLLVTVPG